LVGRTLPKRRGEIIVKNMTLPNGKSSVNRNVNVGDIVCLYWIGFGSDHPMSEFKLPALFRVEEKDERGRHKFTHLDTGKIVSDFDGLSSLTEYMYWPSDVFDDIEYCKNAEKKSHEESFRRVKLERDLLRQIIVEQGVRIVTEDQAKQLGLKA
jgi:hypothetical protein